MKAVVISASTIYFEIEFYSCGAKVENVGPTYVRVIFRVYHDDDCYGDDCHGDDCDVDGDDDDGDDDDMLIIKIKNYYRTHLSYFIFSSKVLLLQLILNAFDFRQALRKPEQVQLDDAEMQKMKQFDMELERALSRLETKEPGSLHHQM